MRRFTLPRTLAVALLLVFAPQGGFGQSQTTASPQQGVRDAQAVAVVQTALTAMGGTAVISQVQNSVVQGTSVDQPIQQNISQSFTWTYAGQNFRDENDATYGSHVLVSNSGSPQDFHDGAWNVVPAVLVRTNLPYHIPALVLSAELSNPGYTFVLVGATTLNSNNAIHIQTCDNSDLTGQLYTLQDWYFDPVSGLPLAVQFGIPVSQNPQDSLHQTMSFANYQAINGMLVPFQLNITMNQLSFVVTVSSAVFNANVAPSIFVPSTAGVQ
jgi:hypothetical protein